VNAVGGQVARASVACGARVGVCPCMGCRQNLKKEKRLRNRVNAFRFKKQTPFRFIRPGSNGPEEQKKADEDAAYFGLVFSYSAEAAAAEAAAAKEGAGAKQE